MILKNLKTLNGLGADDELESFSDSVALMAVIIELSDAYLIGLVKDMLEEVKMEKKGEIEKLKVKLLAKYDTEEALKGLLVEAWKA